MSDFLHNLRTGKFKRHDRNNRAYNDAQNKPSHWRNDNDKRKGTPQISGVSERATSLITESIVEIKSILENIAAAQKRLASAYESKVSAQERTADAMENIAALLKGSLETGKQQASQAHRSLRRVTQVNKSTGASDADMIAGSDREELLNNILAMRKAGMSYEQVAQQLDSEGIATMSGKGKWRAPAVSKLCKEMACD